MRAIQRPFKAAPLLLALLTACGGGGNGDSSAPADTSATSIAPGTGTISMGDTSTGGTGIRPTAGNDSSAQDNAGTGNTGSSTGHAAGTSTTGSTGGAGNTSTTGTATHTAATGSTATTGTNNTASAAAQPPLPGIDPEEAARFFTTLTHTEGCDIRHQTKAYDPKKGTDPRQKDQWFLKNTGSVLNSSFLFPITYRTTAGIDLNVQAVWAKGYRGEGIRVAVLDDGVELTHDDLMENVVPGASFNFIGFDPSGRGQHKASYGNAWPMPCNANALGGDTHGTNVAGVIAARGDNGTGGKGVAPGAGLLGLNVLKASYDTTLIKALTWQPDTTHVYNSSWGAADSGQFHAGKEGFLGRAIRAQLRDGRGGLGSIYVFSAGNGGITGDYSLYETQVSLLGVLPACAVSAAGKRSGFSEPGPNLLVCGLSGDVGWPREFSNPGIVTSTIQDKYRDDFSGTSASAPMVSGVIALMLQANPGLTWRDVRLILARSARKVHADSTGWRTYQDISFNHEYGFGLVDADKAVNMARTWQSVGGSSTLKQCGPFELSAGQKNQPIPEVSLLNTSDLVSDDEDPRKLWKNIDFNRPVAGGMQSTIAIDASCDIRHIEHVDVHLTATPSLPGNDNNGLGDLHVSLTSPSGQTSTLALARQCFDMAYDSNTLAVSRSSRHCGELNNFRFGLSRHLEEPAVHGANRNWTLTAADRVAGKTSVLHSWSITLYGR